MCQEGVDFFSAVSRGAFVMWRSLSAETAEAIAGSVDDHPIRPHGRFEGELGGVVAVATNAPAETEEDEQEEEDGTEDCTEDDGDDCVSARVGDGAGGCAG